MHTIPGTFPRGAITRIRSQTASPSVLQSCQQEITVRCVDYTTLGTYLATPGHVWVWTVGDHNQILPYTSLGFRVALDAKTQPDAPWADELFLTAADTTAALAAARLASQINTFAATMGAIYPDVRSLRAASNDADLTIYMPWGMLGVADLFDVNGPLGEEGAAVGNPGVDNPLVFGIIGPRRHVFRVNFPFRSDYYGEIPIG
jgi:hypothetical protein